MIAKFFQKLSTIRREEEGSVSIEVLLFVPLMVSIIGATFALHDGYRHKSLNIKAAHTISDAISRETEPLDDAYLDGMVELLSQMTRTQSQHGLRVSQIRFDADANLYVLEWSHARGAVVHLSGDDMTGLAARLPDLVDNERIVLVETEVDLSTRFPDWMPLLSGDGVLQTFSFARPRFAPQIVWEST